MAKRSKNPLRAPGRQEARFALNLVDTDVPPDEDPEGTRIDREKTLEARKKMAEASRDKPHGMPLLARAVHKLWCPSISTPEVRKPTESETRMAELTREDRYTGGIVGSCFKCVHFDLAEGQRQFDDPDTAQEFVTELGGDLAVSRLGDLREYGYCEATQGFVSQWGPMCKHYRDKTRILGKLWGGAVGTWKRLGGID